MQKSEGTKIDLLLKELKITQVEFAKALKVTNGAVTNWKKRELGVNVINKITDAFPQVSTIWLLKGEGPILQDKNEDIEKIAWHIETRPRLPLGMSECGIECYINGGKSYMCDHKPVIKQFPPYEFTWIYIKHYMDPVYRRGDEIAFKKVSSIHGGHEYLLDTIDGPVFRIIYEEGDHFRCRSYMPEKFPDFIIPISDVRGAYKVVGMFRI